jgi:pilus assembly protein CpaF
MTSLSERLEAARRQAESQGKHAGEPDPSDGGPGGTAPADALSAPARPAEPAHPKPAAAGPLSQRTAAAATGTNRSAQVRALAGNESDRI